MRPQRSCASVSSVCSSLSDPGKAVTTKASAPSRAASSAPKKLDNEPVLGEPKLVEAPSLRRMRPTLLSWRAKASAIPNDVKIASAPPATTAAIVSPGCSKPSQGPSRSP